MGTHKLKRTQTDNLACDIVYAYGGKTEGNGPNMMQKKLLQGTQP